MPYKFGGPVQADEHAIVQYGDPILSCARDVRSSMRPSELLRVFPELASMISGRGMAALRDPYTLDKIWQTMVSRAVAPPSDPGAVLRQVADDRRATRVSGVQYHVKIEDMDMTEAQVEEKAVKAKKEKKEKAPKAEKPVRPINTLAKHAPTSVVTFGNDPEGNPYGAENNPKRPGSAAHARFNLYVAGKTVAETLAAGVTRPDINWDTKQGFIILV